MLRDRSHRWTLPYIPTDHARERRTHPFKIRTQRLAEVRPPVKATCSAGRGVSAWSTDVSAEKARTRPAGAPDDYERTAVALQGNKLYAVNL